ncbi:beta-defensin 118 [Microtus oregoni]|uniref:beta-defensin 118 n=1 Tax=Microtus oregoni TaxID=111838 RepID=UPI001BB27F4A|nr:beta-defensin 118 [Microtus oregoni]
MRLLLLALPVLALLPQVIPAYGGEKKCLSVWGSCRKKCKNGEIFQDTCKHHRVCCVPDTRERKRKVSVTVGWTTGTTEATSAAYAMDFDFNSEFKIHTGKNS